MQEIITAINEVVGTDLKEINGWQMALRTIVIYIFSIALVRWGHKRFMGGNTAFDIILGYILGSVLSRGINGQAPFLLTLEASILLIAMHMLFSMLGYYSKFFGRMIKGEPHLLGKDGKLLEDQLQRHRITKEDIAGALRKAALEEDPKAFRKIVLENSGHISGILNSQPKIIQLPVENGVQIIRIEIGSSAQ